MNENDQNASECTEERDDNFAKPGKHIRWTKNQAFLTKHERVSGPKVSLQIPDWNENGQSASEYTVERDDDSAKPRKHIRWTKNQAFLINMIKFLVPKFHFKSQTGMKMAKMHQSVLKRGIIILQSHASTSSEQKTAIFIKNVKFWL